MSAAPEWKVYRSGQYIAACRYAEDAAALVSLAGGEVRFGHRLRVWREGDEEFPAGESYDGAADVMLGRVREAIKTADALRRAAAERRGADGAGEP